MATVCRIPPENTIYDDIRIALNERRVWDAVVLYAQLTPDQRMFFFTEYPEIYRNYERAATQFLR